MQKIFDLPEIPMSIIAGLVFVAVVAVGILATRRVVHSRANRDSSWNDAVEMTLTVFSMFYGILLGLLVVSAYENLDESDDVVANEASVISVVYRNFEGFPEPTRTTLVGGLRDYAQEVVDNSFAQQAQGLRPRGEMPFIASMFKTVQSFVPKGANEVSLQAETMRQLSNLQDSRHARLNNVDMGIPGTLWFIVGLGAAITLGLICLLDFPLRSHLTFGCLLAFFIGATIFVTASMDSPYAGVNSTHPDKIQDLINLLPAPR